MIFKVFNKIICDKKDVQRLVRVGAGDGVTSRVYGSLEPELKKIYTAPQKLVVESLLIRAYPSGGKSFCIKIKEQVFVKNNIMRKNCDLYCLTSKTFGLSRRFLLTLFSSFRIISSSLLPWQINLLCSNFKIYKIFSYEDN